MDGLCLVVLFLFSAFLRLDSAAGDVQVLKNNSSSTFASTEANFAPRVHGSGLSGRLFSGDPSDACSSLESQNLTLGASESAFLLTMRGNCSFETKVRVAQDAGFSAVIIFDSEYGADLVTMAGSSDGIQIHAVFITREAGEVLAEYVDDTNAEIWILPEYENALWSILVFSIISMIAIAAALATWFIVRRHRNQRLGGRFLGPQEPCVISPRVVEAMTSITYKVNENQKATQDACAICLEDYISGEKLRVLPCSHRFHSTCIDAWLTMWQAFCPICKRDARLENCDLRASERTPLLRPGFRSRGDTLSASPESLPIQIPPSVQADSPSGSSQNSLSSSSQQLKSCSGSPVISSLISNSPNLSRYSMLQSSLEAFRASPYFTPPSSSHNTSPLLPNTYSGTCVLDGSPSADSPSSFSSSSRSKSYLNPSKKTYSASKLSLDL